LNEFRCGESADNSGDAGGESNSGDRKRKKKSRWASGPENEKTFIPGMPTILPSNLNPDQQEAYLGNYQTLYCMLLDQHKFSRKFIFTTFRNFNQFSNFLN
jgi:hypothetical protein